MRLKETHLRQATADDMDAVSAAISASYTTYYRDWYDDALLATVLPIITKANPKLLRSGTYHVIECDDVVAACGGWTSAGPGDGPTHTGIGHIRHFATHPDFGGKGFARALLERCINDAAMAGMTQLSCLSSLPAEGFYARFGFRAVRESVAMISETIAFPCIEMERPL